jgi:tRNA U34 5-methylaminomethyl-2-thiouridine-forming methyltransferase MnmC
MESYRLVRVVGGVHSVRCEASGETFHPVIGPVAEAEALYVRQLRLIERMRSGTDPFVIWDVGLGAAANVLTVLRAAREVSRPLVLRSFERTLEPLRFALSKREELGYFAGYEEPVAGLLSDGSARFVNGGQEVLWELSRGDFPSLLGSHEAARWPKPHAILFDAYSPARNPEMWTAPLFARMFGLLDPDRPCALATYSRSTMLRVTLLLAGFRVGAGHATGVTEETTLAANHEDLLDDPLGEAWLRRARHSTSAEPMRDAEYRQAPLREETWERLARHPQFAGHRMSGPEHGRVEGD